MVGARRNRGGIRGCVVGDDGGGWWGGGVRVVSRVTEQVIRTLFDLVRDCL